jgi:hypothetical protein
MSTVLEGSTKAVVAIEFFGFFRQHPIYTALAPPHLPVRNSRRYAGDRPPSGSGPCQRGRDRRRNA